MTQEQLDNLKKEVGTQAAERIKSEMAAYEKTAKEVAETAVKNGGLTKEQFEEYKAATEKAHNELKEICAKQGITIGELSEKMNSGTAAVKSISAVLKENEDELRKVFKQGSGTKQFIVGVNSKGEFVMQPYDPTVKAAGPHATVGGVGGGGNTASITQSIDAASLLRIGGNSPIVSQFRNTPWVFDLVNLVNAGLDTPFAMWYEEVAKNGSSATVAEGTTKPLTQYAYELKTASYKKEATLISITEEFSIDFQRLESDILGKGRMDVINRVNTAVLSNIISAATAYNTQASFASPAITDVNDFDVLAAMSAQVDNATHGNIANAAVTSTFKKYRMGIEKSLQGEYLNRPEVINNLNIIGNPAMAADAVLVGDFRNYNIILKGGFIVKVGYNGTDFAENKFSVVMEQFYFDYISEIRKVAIVKGPSFATVRGLIGESAS